MLTFCSFGKQNRAIVTNKCKTHAHKLNVTFIHVSAYFFHECKFFLLRLLVLLNKFNALLLNFTSAVIIISREQFLNEYFSLIN